jgi:hypothetical protein
MFFSKAYTDQESRLSPGFSQINKDAQHRFSQNFRLTRQFYSATDYHSSKKIVSPGSILLPATFEKGQGTAIFLNVGLPKSFKTFFVETPAFANLASSSNLRGPLIVSSPTKTKVRSQIEMLRSC